MQGSEGGVSVQQGHWLTGDHARSGHMSNQVPYLSFNERMRVPGTAHDGCRSNVQYLFPSCTLNRASAPANVNQVEQDLLDAVRVSAWAHGARP